MKGVFISYRRGDAASEARLLYNLLRRSYGDGLVFMDVEALREPGMDFVDAIDRSLKRCDVVLAVMGQHWQGTSETGDSRLHHADDFIRLEIATALERRVRVIPVLVDGAAMPAQDSLPEELRPLSRLQALVLSHEDWDYTTGKLLAALENSLGYRRIDGEKPPTPPRKKPPWRRGWVAVLVAVVLGLGLLAEFVTQAPEPVYVSTVPSAPLAVVPDAPSTDETHAGKGEYPTVKTAPAAAGAVDVVEIQRLLASLGYDPGAVDGVAGPATREAAAAFQTDHGIWPAEGRVDAALLAALQAAAGELPTGQGQLGPLADQLSELAAPAQPAVDISGIWYNDAAIAFQVNQSGSLVQFRLDGQLVGQGQIAGGVLVLDYNVLGEQGRLTASLDPDGNHLRGSSVDVFGVVQQVVLHNGHLPQY